VAKEKKTRRRLPGSSKPLAGKRIVITRARSQAGTLARHIEELGGEAIAVPTIEIQEPESYAALDGAIDKIRSYDWVIFTSVNGVEEFFKRCRRRKIPLTELQNMQVAAIGPETARKLEGAGVRNILVPKEYQAEGLLEVFRRVNVRGKRVLIPRAAKARDLLPQTLRQWGAAVSVVEAYRTVLPQANGAAIKKSLSARKVDMVTFTSSSTVANFVELFQGQSLAELLPKSAIACIGPITKKTVEDMGGKVDVVSPEFTIPGLVRAIVNYFRHETEKLKPPRW